jgi:hypothetical protein
MGCLPARSRPWLRFPVTSTTRCPLRPGYEAGARGRAVPPAARTPATGRSERGFGHTGRAPPPRAHRQADRRALSVFAASGGLVLGRPPTTISAGGRRSHPARARRRPPLRMPGSAFDVVQGLPPYRLRVDNDQDVRHPEDQSCLKPLMTRSRLVDRRGGHHDRRSAAMDNTEFKAVVRLVSSEQTSTSDDSSGRTYQSNFRLSAAVTGVTNTRSRS